MPRWLVGQNCLKKQLKKENKKRSTIWLVLVIKLKENGYWLMIFDLEMLLKNKKILKS